MPANWLPSRKRATGLFEILEGSKSQGFLAVDDDDWDYYGRGDLSYDDVEAVVEAIRASETES